MCRLLASERITILAMALDTIGHLRLVVDNHTRALNVLRHERRTVSARDVLYVATASEPGGAASVFEVLGNAGVNVDHSYCGVDGAAGILVIGVDDPLRVAALTGL